jgi:hypothetical protein
VGWDGTHGIQMAQQGPVVGCVSNLGSVKCRKVLIGTAGIPFLGLVLPSNLFIS